MEASLPISAAVNSPPQRTVAATSPEISSVTLPLRFILSGLLALLGGTVWIIAQPGTLALYHYNQNVIALTHLFVLGWICSVVMGAMYQLVPVALETKLYSLRLARWQFILHVVGFVGMVWMFRVWNMKQVGHFGFVLGVGVILFVYNIGRTLFRVPKWNVVATAIAAALFWISFTILAGLSIATAKCSYDSVQSTNSAIGALGHGLRLLAGVVQKVDPISAMHAHAHLGGIGFFTMLIVGISYKLIPMFTLSEIQSRRRAALSIVLLNVGLMGSFATILLRSPLKLLFAAMVVAGLAVYGIELVAILRARKRKPLDWGIKYFLSAVALLVPLSLLALVLSWPGLPLNRITGQTENTYGFLGLIGVVSFAIIGMLYKIIPFLIWFDTYSRYIGRARVPALAEMYSVKLQGIGYWTFLGGITVTIAGILLSNGIVVRTGAVLLVASFSVLAANVGKILSHHFRPQLTPLNPQLARAAQRYDSAPH